jgi:hypothetical protein
MAATISDVIFSHYFESMVILLTRSVLGVSSGNDMEVSKKGARAFKAGGRQTGEF